LKFFSKIIFLCVKEEINPSEWKVGGIINFRNKTNVIIEDTDNLMSALDTFNKVTKFDHGVKLCVVLYEFGKHPAIMISM